MKSNKPNVIVIILTVMICAFIVFYLSKYHEWQTTPIRDDYEDIEFSDDKKPKENVKVSKIDDKKAKNIYNKYRFNNLENFYGSDFKNIYYSNADFSSEYMIYLAIINLYGNDIQLNCHFKKEIAANDLDIKIKELFGNHLYNKISFTVGKMIVNYENDSYKIEIDSCDNNLLNRNFVGCDYYGNKEEDGRLIITEIAYLVSIKDDGGLGYNYHEDVTEDSKILGNDLNLIDKKNFSKYSYIFINDGSNYYLEKIVKGE